jgi:hypothetical protein
VKAPGREIETVVVNSPLLPQRLKVEIREGEEGSQIVATQRTWEEVETFFIQALSNKRGKRFIFEIESNVYTDIYFQGYSEPDLSRTIEAAADLSVRPMLSDKQKLVCRPSVGICLLKICRTSSCSGIKREWRPFFGADIYADFA